MVLYCCMITLLDNCMYIIGLAKEQIQLWFYWHHLFTLPKLWILRDNSWSLCLLGLPAKVKPYRDAMRIRIGILIGMKIGISYEILIDFTPGNLTICYGKWLPTKTRLDSSVLKLAVWCLGGTSCIWKMCWFIKHQVLNTIQFYFNIVAVRKSSCWMWFVTLGLLGSAGHRSSYCDPISEHFQDSNLPMASIGMLFWVAQVEERPHCDMHCGQFLGLALVYCWSSGLHRVPKKRRVIPYDIYLSIWLLWMNPYQTRKS